MDKDEFCKRFKIHMIKMAGEKFDDGSSIAEYADACAETYFDELPPDTDETPEECAETDISYWGE